MTAADIVKIIKACKESNVRRIKLEDLELEFTDLTNNALNSNNSINIGLNDRVCAPETMAVPEIEKLENELSEKRHGEVMDEFALANLMADNPVAFENHQRGILNEE